MKTVIDSSAWIEWFIASPTGDALMAHWPPREETLVPTLVQLEIAKWLKREISEKAMDRALAYMERCVLSSRSTPASRSTLLSFASHTNCQLRMPLSMRRRWRTGRGC
jgi:predicted nucleic acid-binding protein